MPHDLRSKMVAPSILSADFANLERDMKKAEQAGADWHHVDVMDGHFVNNITIGPPVVASIKKISGIPLDVHLMIENPEKYIKAFCEAGSDYLTIHVESTKDPKAAIEMIRSFKVKPGITLRPRTDISQVIPLLPYVDLVLVMTVEPGFGGQSFMLDQVEKINVLRAEIEARNYSCLIEVDGGVNDKTIQYLNQADVLVAGNFVYRSADLKSAIQILKGT